MSKTVLIIFLIIATVFAVGSLIYVVVDYVLEKKKDKEEEEKEPVAAPVPVVVHDSEPEHVVVPPVITVVDHIDAEEADEILTDEEAMTLVIFEEKGPKTEGYRSYVNLGRIDEAFDAGDTVTIEALYAKKMINRRTKRVKILADGVLTKPLTIKAHSFSIQAVKMIELTGGTVVLIR